MLASSISMMEDNSMRVMDVNSTRTVDANSTRHMEANTAKAMKDNFSGILEDNSSSTMEGNSSSTMEGNSSSTMEDGESVLQTDQESVLDEEQHLPFANESFSNDTVVQDVNPDDEYDSDTDEALNDKTAVDQNVEKKNQQKTDKSTKEKDVEDRMKSFEDIDIKKEANNAEEQKKPAKRHYRKRKYLPESGVSLKLSLRNRQPKPIAGRKSKTSKKVKLEPTVLKRRGRKPKARMLNCPDCTMQYKSERMLEKHIKSKHTDRHYKCGVCADMFVTAEDLNAHLREEHNWDKVFKCGVCEQGFSCFEKLQEHITVSHSWGQGFWCALCNMAFAECVELSEHLRDIHFPETVRSWPCKECDRTFKSKSKRERHWSLHHSEDQPSFACNECFLSFRSKYLLRRHKIKMHSDSEDIKLDPDAVPSNSNLATSKRFTDSKLKVFICSICGRSFDKAGSLSDHRQTHSEKRYMCETCGKGFHQRSNLHKHRRTHNLEVPPKPYQCEVCSKSFREKSIFIRHKRVHTGESPYQCDMCGKSFHSSINLRLHLQTVFHGGERSHMCEVCGKGFTKRHHLNAHKIIHSGERPYACLLCEYRCVQKSNLKIHVKGVHPDKLDILYPEIGKGMIRWSEFQKIQAEMMESKITSPTTTMSAQTTFTSTSAPQPESGQIMMTPSELEETHSEHLRSKLNPAFHGHPKFSYFDKFSALTQPSEKVLDKDNGVIRPSELAHHHRPAEMLEDEMNTVSNVQHAKLQYFDKLAAMSRPVEVNTAVVRPAHAHQYHRVSLEEMGQPMSTSSAYLSEEIGLNFSNASDHTTMSQAKLISPLALCGRGQGIDETADSLMAKAMMQTPRSPGPYAVADIQPRHMAFNPSDHPAWPRFHQHT